MKIKIIELTNDIIPCSGSYKNDWGFIKQFDSFKVSEVSGSRVYITVFNGQMKLTQIAKKMEFNNEAITIKIGNEVIAIGKYEIAA